MIDDINNDDGWLQGEFKINPTPRLRQAEWKDLIDFALSTSLLYYHPLHSFISFKPTTTAMMKPVLSAVQKNLGPVVLVTTSDDIFSIIFKLKVNIKPKGSALSLSFEYEKQQPSYSRCTRQQRLCCSAWLEPKQLQRQMELVRDQYFSRALSVVL